MCHEPLAVSFCLTKGCPTGISVLWVRVTLRSVRTALPIGQPLIPYTMPPERGTRTCVFKKNSLFSVARGCLKQRCSAETGGGRGGKGKKGRKERKTLHPHHMKFVTYRVCILIIWSSWHIDSASSSHEVRDASASWLYAIQLHFCILIIWSSWHKRKKRRNERNFEDAASCFLS